MQRFPHCLHLKFSGGMFTRRREIWNQIIQRYKPDPLRYQMVDVLKKVNSPQTLKWIGRKIYRVM